MFLTGERDTEMQFSSIEFALPCAAGVLVWRGAAGFAVPGGHPSALFAFAIAQQTVDNTLGGPGLAVRVRRGAALLTNSAGANKIRSADKHKRDRCFIVDDQTVANAPGAGPRIAANLFDFDADGVWVTIDAPIAPVTP
jgi:hypothetical protein